jgi:FAD-dependent oxidoreductase domain-containing protein 1
MVDVVIIGGGSHGGFTAWHLKQREPGLEIVVVERDPTYEHAASVRTSAGVRLLFSQEENIRLSQYCHEIYNDFGDLMAIDGEPQPLTFWRQGYLLMANTLEQAEAMEANYKFQTAMGAEADLIDATELKRRFPSLNTHDVLVASHSPKDGWIDPYGALTAVRRKNIASGVRYVQAAATAFDVSGGQVRSVTLSTGETITADWFVNTTGAWASEITALLGFDIPVVPLPRNTFYFEIQEEIEPIGLTIDGLGCSIRPEGKGFITGRTVFDRAGEFDWTVYHDRFDAENWPNLSNRVTACEALKVKNAWACHYALSTWDGNMLMGAWPGQPQNFLMATGFSGHGLQHAAGSGRGLSELILDGKFTTLDLSRFAAIRVAEGRKEPEVGFKA